MGHECDQNDSNDNDASMPSSLFSRIVSGSIGSIITALAVTPLEVVKIRQQASLPKQNVSQRKHATRKMNVNSFPVGRSTSYIPCLVAPGHTGFMTHPVSPANLSPRFYESTLCTGHPASQEASSTPASTLRALRSISKNEGISGLYTGLRPTLLMTVPNTALTLTLYDEITTSLRANYQSHTSLSESSRAQFQIYSPLFAGAFSRLVSSSVTAPLELIRTRQASFHSNNGGRIVGSPPGVIDEFRFLLRTNGIVGLYAGLTVTLLRDVSFSALYFFCLEQFRTKLNELNGLGRREYSAQHGMPVPLSITITHNFLSGAAAATVATLLTGPFDVVKTRRQMVRNGHIQRNHSTLALMKNIYKHEGIAGLWKGNQARMAKVVPANAIMISCYELGKGVIKEMLK
ncbi:hypothetical protein HJC23_014071 [Cyclotella cryptica]|uniref:Mitochondrial carrier protein n=1 Tax=Cyclotella cryptica TaxID=29204 RepID=A0ABD3QSV8_9STRA|eukprot:CCRYP_002467-RA/>CCRYP_002467-RA protein AED:0.18 eAED:0.18 QI:0/-1/0/1/-1/1/1/0/402